MRKSLNLIKFLGAGFLSLGAISISAAAINHTYKSNANKADAAVDYSDCETAHQAGDATALLEAMRTVTASGTSGSYNDLWTTYNTAYKKSNGKIKDYYSNSSSFTPTTDKCGSDGYQDEGDCYNREHSIPQSWWGSGTGSGTQGTDPFFVVPTDGFVNNKRASYPLGVVSSASYTSDNGYSKLGTSSSYGYSNTVFEPNDEVKGDFARMHFYVIAKYSESCNWTKGEGGSTFSGGTGSSKNYGLTAYAVKLFTKWNNDDKPDDWERSVNTKLYGIQGNTNPFIDHPEYANTMWGNVSGATWYDDGSTPSTDPTITINPTSLTLTEGGSTGTITATISNGSGDVTWTSSDTDVVTVSSSGANKTTCTVTPVAAGTATITAYYSTATPVTCSVTVNSSGGGGGDSSTYELYSGALTEGNYVIYYGGKAMKNTVSSDRFSYTEVTPNNDIIEDPDESIVWHIAPSGNYWTIYNEAVEQYVASTGTKNQAALSNSGTDDKSLWTVSGTSTYEFVNKNNASKSVNANLRENTTYGFACYSTSTGGALSLYKQGEGGGDDPTLTGITIKTAPTKTTYTSGETFSPTNLVITTNYSDSSYDTDVSYAGHTSDFTFSPSLNTALKTNNDKVTITYGGKSADQAITVNPSSITASPKKDTYYVGETISAEDITVTDNDGFDVTGFTFSPTSYQFVYGDSSAGGVAKNKTFTNAVSYANKTASVTFSVNRQAYVEPSSTQEVTDTITAADLAATTTSYVDFSNVTKTSAAKYAGQSAKDASENIQLRSKNSNSGLVSTTSGGTIKSVKITVASGTNTINVYGKNTAYSAATDLYNTSSQGTNVGTLTSTSTITFTSDYTYVGIRSNNGAVYISSIEITYKGSSGQDDALNVSNFIMYEDTNNQCNTKLGQAITKLNTMPKTEKDLFWTPGNNYVIATAKTRLQAWATSKGKTLTYEDGEYSVDGAKFNIMFKHTESSSLTLILIMISITSTMIGFIFVGYYLKKKER